MGRLQVGVETTCTAPLWVERLGMRMAKLAGVDSLLLPDHYLGFVPTAFWKPEYTPAAKMVPSTDAFFDPFVMLGMMVIGVWHLARPVLTNRTETTRILGNVAPIVLTIAAAAGLQRLAADPAKDFRLCFLQWSDIPKRTFPRDPR